MEYLLPLSRVVLMLVFALAGVLKARDLKAVRQTMQDFGVPARLIPVLSVLLPLAEFGTAAALAWNRTTWFGALASLVLLLLFSAGIAWNLMHGRTPPCNCFGQISAKPISRLTLLRNLLLAACCVIVLVAGRTGIGPGVASLVAQVRVQPLPALVAGLAFLVAACLFLLMQVMQQHGRILVRLDELAASQSGDIGPPQANLSFAAGLPVGAEAPAFQAGNLAGESVSLRNLLEAGKELVFVFMNPYCGPCNSLLEDMPRWMSLKSALFQCAVLSEGKGEEIAQKFAGLDTRRVLVLPDRSIPAEYHAWGTPSAIVVSREGKVASLVARGVDSIRALLHSLEQGSLLPAALGEPGRSAAPVPRRSSPASLAIGDPLPSMDLRSLSPGLDGPTISLDRFKGSPLLMLFWNPACGFCTQMLHQLRAWEFAATDRSLRLLLISTGRYEDHLQMHLQAPIAMDDDSRIANLLGSAATPSAVVIDAGGRIATPLAAGAEAIFAMAEIWR